MNRMLGSTMMLLVPLACGLAVLAQSGGETASRAVSRHGPFLVRSYIGKCLTYGQTVLNPGRNLAPALGGGFQSASIAAPVFIDDCPRRAIVSAPIRQNFQQIVVEEINDRREVTLRAGNKYIGVLGNALAERVPLELQDFNGGPGQAFALDGDSIILAADRGLVIEIRNGKGATGTPLVLGRRDLNDSEFWDFNAADGTAKSPTSGFVRVIDSRQLDAAMKAAAWGTVIQLEQSDSPFDLTRRPTLEIPGGVTIRGNRRGINLGPEISVRDIRADRIVLRPTGDNVRITGLRLTGSSRSQDRVTPYDGIQVSDTFSTTIIDNNQMSNWTSSALEVQNAPGVENWACSETLVRRENVRIFRNFFHHNVSDGLGYGVVLGRDGYARILGNTFLMNRHAIAADGSARTGYSAWFNLVLSNAPSFGAQNREQADFDMHGSDASSEHTGGIGGSEVEIARNTFLGTNRQNFDLRGKACGPNRFVNNVTRQPESAALRWYVPRTNFTNGPFAALSAVCEAELKIEPGDPPVKHSSACGSQTSPPVPPPVWLEISNNTFRAANPTARLGVGDFDGDGRDDLFLATGQAWYFSPGGVVEWRYLNARTDPIDALRFGDFDRDGRTDVFTKHGNDLVISWGGLSDWERINQSTHSLSDYAIGDFDGDRRADVFHANGKEWFVSSGGVSTFAHYARAIHRVKDLRFGDFNGDGRTDVFGVESGAWKFVPGGGNTWQTLRSSALTGSVDGLVVADFDGDGRADVGHSVVAFLKLWSWRVSRSGTRAWTTVNSDTIPLFASLGVGRFDDVAGADVITWGHGNGLALDIVTSARGPVRRWSTQEMR